MINYISYSIHLLQELISLPILKLAEKDLPWSALQKWKSCSKVGYCYLKKDSLKVRFYERSGIIKPYGMFSIDVKLFRCSL